MEATPGRPSQTPTFSIIGAGLAGPLMTAYLGRAGYDVHLFESRSDPRKTGVITGRSINLALSRRGLHALKEVGLQEPIQEISIPMRGRMMHANSGKLSFQPYGTAPDQFLCSVSRGRLNQILLDSAESCPGVKISFDHKCTDVDLDTGLVTFAHPSSGGESRVETEILIGADGAFSRVRAAMQKCDRFDYQQDYLGHGYKELSMPPKLGGGFALSPNALHIWPRRTYMMIALPNQDETFTCTLFCPFDGDNSFDLVRTDSEIMRFFETTFPDVIALIPDLVREFQSNKVGSLVTVRCHPWHMGGRTVLLGDAAHAVVPFYGQGINAGFEDCTVLFECIRKQETDLTAAISEYDQLRKKNADVLADLALSNFVEMRDHVGSGLFLMKKSGERALHKLFPWWYVPLYSMVTFTRIPYAEIKRISDRQNRIVAGSGSVLVLILVMLAVLGLYRIL